MSNTTKRALEASLKKLLLQKPLDKITIQDLTTDCGISRMAFYYHFKDIYEIDAITAGKLFQLATVVARALKEVLHCDGLNVLLSHNVDKGQIIELLNQGKYDTTWLEFISQSELEKMYSSYLTPAVGASGAIYGLLVAFAFMFPNAELMMMFIPVPVKAKYFVPVIVLLDLFSGVTGFSLFGGNIAHFAHVGGALIGFIMMWYWKKNQFDKNRWDR